MSRGDMNGKKINHWTILDDLGKGKVICQCDCEAGTVRELYKKAVIGGKSKSCGCVRKSTAIKPGDKFFEWEVLEKRPNRYVLCRCSCGEVREVFEGTLKNGMSKSCGHSKDAVLKEIKSINSQSAMDLSIEGQKFGDWVVIKKINKDKALCRCLGCNTEKELYISNLKRGTSKSCGCKKDEYKKVALDKNFDTKYKDKEFGFWTIIGRGSSSAKALCRCTCGNIKDVYIQQLLDGTSKSCGCKSNYLHIKSMYKRYGEVVHNKINNPREEWQIKTISSRENFIKYLDNMNDKPFVYELCELLNLQEAQMLVIIHKFSLEEYINWNRNQSKLEEELASFVQSIYSGKIERHCRNIIHPNELDIYIPDKKLAIEFNGNYWHSELQKDKHYHRDKTLACMENNIHLIHIFEYEWVNNKQVIQKYIYNQIGEINKTIYGRDTYVNEIENTDEVKDFLQNNHIQGYTQSSINIGLYYKDELVGIMTFGKPRFIENTYEYELIRLCYSYNIRVVGGSEKMFKYFLNKYCPKNIISYCNIGKFTGEIYQKLGFKMLDISKENYVWINNNKTLSRYQTQKSILIAQGLGTEKQTEDEIMHSLNYCKIYDCGNIRYIYSKE